MRRSRKTAYVQATRGAVCTMLLGVHVSSARPASCMTGRAALEPGHWDWDWGDCGPGLVWERCWGAGSVSGVEGADGGRGLAGRGVVQDAGERRLGAGEQQHQQQQRPALGQVFWLVAGDARGPGSRAQARGARSAGRRQAIRAARGRLARWTGR